MKRSRVVRPQGQMRRSQLVSAFGPGALLDLPKHSVIISGLEEWGDPETSPAFHFIHEERLLEKVAKALDAPEIRLISPPIDLGGPAPIPSGVTAWQFPEWFVVQKEEVSGPDRRSRRLVHRRALDRGHYFGPDKKRLPVVPVRFVRACINGHIGDLGWHAFVHEDGENCCRQLWLTERGTSGDLADVFVRCECGRSRSLATALPGKDRAAPLGFCDGARPWLGGSAREHCGGEGKAQPSRLLVRTAINAYFAQVLSVIHIPDGDAALRRSVDEVWTDFLTYVETKEDLVKERRRPKVAAAIEPFSDGVVWSEIERRRSGVALGERSIKQAEMETLLSKSPVLGEDTPEGDFYATAVPLDAKRSSLMRKIERVVLVHRLLEVSAQIGFTRFEPAVTDIEGELSLDVRRAPLSLGARWVPAVETRGEGIFIALSRSEITEWLGRRAVQDRLKVLRAGFELWKAQDKAREGQTFPGPRYVLLHSLSHLLITAVSLAAGYAASSIRERIYVTDAGSGLLLHTGTPDAEGTLGGLVQVGRNIERHLREALELGGLCSNDPVCAGHLADDPQEQRPLHGASCHGCLLIAEPSCERRNEYLDRALVVATIEDLGAEFFTDEDL